LALLSSSAHRSALGSRGEVSCATMQNPHRRCPVSAGANATPGGAPVSAGANAKPTQEVPHQCRCPTHGQANRLLNAMAPTPRGPDTATPKTHARRQQDWILKGLHGGLTHPLAACAVTTLCCSNRSSLETETSKHQKQILPEPADRSTALCWGRTHPLAWLPQQRHMRRDTCPRVRRR
jgi:hypothetical protein